VARYRPRLVIALGDSFHDTGGPARLGADDRAALLDLQRGRDWIWVAGNHDPDPAKDIGGVFARSVALGPLVFRHEPTCGAADGEIAGHLHPSACVSQRGRAVTRKCFAADDRRMIMPALRFRGGALPGIAAYCSGLNRGFVMAGHSRSKNGVASLAYVPAIHVFVLADALRRGCPRRARA
jgi:metallophosphoesterase superfamily enzyme